MFSSVFSDFTFRSMTDCELIFMYEMRCRSRFICLADAYPVVPALFVGMTILSLPNCPCILVKSQLSVNVQASLGCPGCSVGLFAYLDASTLLVQCSGFLHFQSCFRVLGHMQCISV